VREQTGLIACQALTKEPTMNAKPSSTPAGIVVSTGIVGGPKKIFIGGLS
jgi:hypothetical protein